MRRAAALLLLCLLPALLAGCQTAASPAAEADAIPVDLEIREKMFLAQTNDIYLNPDEYLGKTVKYEGMFFSGQYGDGDFMMVIRYGPGCCGDDANVGFEVAWDGNAIQKPNENDWVEVIGQVEEYWEHGTKYIRIGVQSLRALDTRGTETILQ